MKIRALSLWEPWATAWAIGLKIGETRSWAPIVDGQSYRGPLAVCAAKTQRDPDEGYLLRDWFDLRLRSCLDSAYAFAAVGITRWSDLHFGHVIAICELADVRPTRLCGPHTKLEASWGNYSDGRQVWLSARMTRLASPIPVVGRQGLFAWEVPAELLQLPALAAMLLPRSEPAPARAAAASGSGRSLANTSGDCASPTGFQHSNSSCGDDTPPHGTNAVPPLFL